MTTLEQRAKLAAELAIFNAKRKAAQTINTVSTDDFPVLKRTYKSRHGTTL